MGSEEPVNSATPVEQGYSNDGQTHAVLRRAAFIIAGMFVFLSASLLYTAKMEVTEWAYLVFQHLYYAPILYAAFIFGRRGGLISAAVASVPQTVHSYILSPTTSGLDPNHTVEVLMYFVIGGLFGALRDAQEQRTRDLQQLGVRLEDAYAKLEDRAIQLINVQDYTQSILRSITSGVVTVGPDGSITTINPAAERMLGITEDDAVPKPISSVFEDDGGLTDDVGQVLAGRIPLVLKEAELVTRSGRTVHVQAVTSRMRAVGGRILGAVVTMEDVSEITALTEQLIKADRLAAMGQLTAGVAHEIRNPLGIIRASVQLLEDRKGDIDQTQEIAHVIKQEIDRLDRVIKALLDFGRPNRPTFVSVDIEDVLRNVVLFTSRFAREAEVRITEDFQGDMPRVLADPDQLKQVFLNLVTNSVQAMQGRGGTIQIRTLHANEFVHVFITDTGPGIPPSEVGRIFDPFYSTRDEGTGLGLTIVHRIIDQHNGHIDVASSPGTTTFRVRIPVAVEEEHGREDEANSTDR